MVPAILSAAVTFLMLQPPLPLRLDDYLTRVVKLSASERARLASGAPVTKLLDADKSKDVAVFGAVWIEAPMARYVAAVSDIETFERGGSFTITKRISATPALEDFAALHLPEEDVKDLRTCTVGDCEVKLSEQALRRFKAEIDWKSRDATAQADRLMRQLLFELATEYLDGGNARLAVYHDKARPTVVASEFDSMTGLMPELTTYMPNVRRALLEFPAATLPGSTSFLYWQETAFGLKSTIRVNHLTIREGADDTVVTSKMLYASHYFWTALELRVLLRDRARGEGFWLVTVSRSRSDGLSGFMGRMLRGRVRRKVEDGSLSALRSTKRLLEAAK